MRKADPILLTISFLSMGQKSNNEPLIHPLSQKLTAAPCRARTFQFRKDVYIEKNCFKKVVFSKGELSMFTR